jgi:hypothetical protein
MPTKKPPSKPKAAAKPAPPPTRLQNLAARPAAFDDTIDEQLVDHSGVFRVTSQIAQAQTGHDEEPTTRFPSDSLVMAAQREGFRDEGATIGDTVDEALIDDEAVRAVKRERLATLAARNQSRRKR